MRASYINVLSSLPLVDVYTFEAQHTKHAVDSSNCVGLMREAGIHSSGALDFGSRTSPTQHCRMDQALDKMRVFLISSQ